MPNVARYDDGHFGFDGHLQEWFIIRVTAARVSTLTASVSQISARQPPLTRGQGRARFEFSW